MENIKFKCAECGSSDIQVRAWVNMNTNEYVNECDDGDFWCGNCENNVDFVEEIEPEKIIKLYTVKLERPLSIRTVDIQASSEEEAIDMAFDMYNDNMILLFDNVDFQVIETNDIDY